MTYLKSTRLPIDLCHLPVLSYCYPRDLSIRVASLEYTFCTFFDGINSLRGCDKNGDGYGSVDLPIKT